MPRTPEQNQAIKDKRRKKLLNAAIKVFAAKRYDDVSIDDITKKVGCSHGLFYHYFETKEIVYGAILDEFFFAKEAEMPNPKDYESLHGVDGLKAVIELGQQAQKGSAQQLCLAEIMLKAIEPGSGIPREEEVRARFDFGPLVLRFIKEGQEASDVVAGDPNEILLAMHDLLLGGIERRLTGSAILTDFISNDVVLELLLKRPL